VILLDTNALIWLEQGHRRTKRLAAAGTTLYMTPASLLELQMLNEIGKIRLNAGALETLIEDERWLLDDPPAGEWFMRSTEVSWTRDPFDRLIVAHARLRGWKLATGDRLLLEQLSARERLEL
jgi:PIN domain nuclease of toxin-antitoxin system